MTWLRRIVRWALITLVAVRLALLVCLASGADIPSPALRALEATTLVPLTACVIYFGGDYRRHRADLPRRAAVSAALDATVPPAFRRLAVHEVRLFTSFLRWVGRRGPQGVGPGDLPVRYAAGQAGIIIGFLIASIVETVALALVIPWPVSRGIVLVVDLWGVYFVVALQASCIVRPHIVGADGSLRLRYGALSDIRVPAAQIARARIEQRFDRGGPLKQHPDGALDLGMGGQTMLTVELTEPVRYTRPLGKQAEAHVLRFYADNPGAAVAALTGNLDEATR